MVDLYLAWGTGCLKFSGKTMPEARAKLNAFLKKRGMLGWSIAR